MSNGHDACRHHDAFAFLGTQRFSIPYIANESLSVMRHGFQRALARIYPTAAVVSRQQADGLRAGELVDQPGCGFAVQASEPGDPGVGFSSHPKGGATADSAIAAVRLFGHVGLRVTFTLRTRMHVSLCAGRVNGKHG